MKKVVRSASQLPAWFDLEHYAAQEQLSLSGWLCQLAVRSDLLRAARPLHDCLHDELAHLQTQPIASISDDQFSLNSWIASLVAQLDGQEASWAAPPVTTMTVKDHLWHADRLGADEVASSREIYRRALDAFYECEMADRVEAVHLLHLLDRPVDQWASGHCTKAHVVVDLTLPDAVLVREFAALLPALRKLAASRAHGPRSSRAKVDPSSWIEFSVLPYIDLQLWADLEGYRIPNRVLADAIFLPGTGGEEVVRKTTAKIANAVIEPSFLTKLVAEAVAESRNEIALETFRKN